MDEVGLHRFIGRCESKSLESIFPMCDQMFISYEELKEQMVFEDTEGREETITYWHNYLACLSNYEPGMHVTNMMLNNYWITQTEALIILDIMRKPNPVAVIVLLYIQKQEAKNNTSGIDKHLMQK